jgi:hypothetical protein
MLEPAVDRFSRPVAGAGSVEVGEHVGGALLQRPVGATQRFSDSNSKWAVGVSANRRQPAKVMVGWR